MLQPWFRDEEAPWISKVAAIVKAVMAGVLKDGPTI